MPTTNPQIKVTLRKLELAHLRSQARDRESDSNLVRRKLKLPALIQGARKGNRNAARKENK